jgi:hypothetical protein
LFLIKETQGFLNAYVFVGANGPPFPWVAGDGLDIVTAWIEEVEVLRAPGPPPGAGPHCPGSPACSELLVPAVELGLSMAGEVGASSGPPPSNEVYVWLFDLDNDLGTGLDPGIDLAVTTGFDDSNPQFGRGRLAVSIYRWNDDTKRWVSQETADTALRQAPVSIDGTDVVLTLRDFALPTSPFRWFAQTSISVGATGTNARNIWTTFIDGTF